MHPFFLILIASIVSMIVGMLWYAPFAFGKVWAKLKGLHFHNKEDMRAYQRSMMGAYIGAFVAAFLTSWTLLGIMGIKNMHGALLLATILWSGLILPATFTAALFDKKDFKLWAIDIGCAYVSMVATTIVLRLF
jgi:hypothetical protein